MEKTHFYSWKKQFMLHKCVFSNCKSVVFPTSETSFLKLQKCISSNCRYKKNNFCSWKKPTFTVGKSRFCCRNGFFPTAKLWSFQLRKQVFSNCINVFLLTADTKKTTSEVGKNPLLQLEKAVVFPSSETDFLKLQKCISFNCRYKKNNFCSWKKPTFTVGKSCFCCRNGFFPTAKVWSFQLQKKVFSNCRNVFLLTADTKKQPLQLENTHFYS